MSGLFPNKTNDVVEMEKHDWLVATVLPNIELDVAIEGGLVALAPLQDERVVSLCEAYPNLRSFLGRFTDAFGVKLAPALLLVRKDAPLSVVNMEALASFRDAVAMAVICYGRASQIVYPQRNRINFSNSFWLYPWILDHNYEYLIANTPALLALHQVKQFQGQSSPELSTMKLSRADIDRTLLSTLTDRWTRRYTRRRAQWRDRALFRSLNMANHASLLPAGNEATFYDLGRSVALWISAFEILVHPGKGRANLAAVYALLDRIEWRDNALRHRRYSAHEGRGSTKAKRTLACGLYGKLYRARNDFLHGNPVGWNHLKINGSEHNLFQYAAPLYRLALTAFLPLSWRRRGPPLSDTGRFGKYAAERMTYLSYQERVEQALLALRKPSRRSG